MNTDIHTFPFLTNVQYHTNAAHKGTNDTEQQQIYPVNMHLQKLNADINATINNRLNYYL